jgi:hypothetical protein
LFLESLHDADDVTERHLVHCPRRTLELQSESLESSFISLILTSESGDVDALFDDLAACATHVDVTWPAPREFGGQPCPEERSLVVLEWVPRLEEVV